MNETQCRVCLLYIDCTFKLDDKVKEQFIWEALNSIAKVSVAVGDTFPQFVCWTCFDKLDQAIEFQQEVEKSDTVLHSNDIELITFIKEEADETKNIFEPIIKIESSKAHLLNQNLKIDDNIKCEDEKVKSEGTTPPQKPKRKRKSRAKSMQIQTNDIGFPCCVCHQSSWDTETELTLHIMACHESVVAENAQRKYTTRHRHECNNCKRKFRLTGSVAEHRKNPDFKEPPRNREKEYANRKTYVVKKRIHQPQVCVTCGMTLASKYHLRLHELSKHPTEFPFACEYPGCGQRFAGKRILARHKDKHKEKKHICDVCGKGFIYERYLKSHSYLHKEVKRYQCAHCPRTFTFRNILQRHIESHFEEKIFRCNQCEKTYKWHTDLKAHYKGAHLGNYPYKCKYCDKGYFCSSSRKYHQDRCQVGRTLPLIS